jgi:molybdate transport system substrate-binding protein
MEKRSSPQIESKIAGMQRIPVLLVRTGMRCIPAISYKSFWAASERKGNLSVLICAPSVAKIIFSILLCLFSPALAQNLTVSAAISLKDAMNAEAKEYQKQGGDAVRLNFGASGDLANQIIAGAPVDLFISAGKEQIEQLQRAKVVEGKPVVIVKNEVVLIAPTGSEIHSWQQLGGKGLKGEKSVKRIAIGDPKSVPAGQYATEVFAHLGLTDQVGGKIIYASNVRQVLAYVERGEVDAGVVYATDAKQAGAKVRVVAVAPAGSHEAIEYPVVMIRGGHGEKARKFLGFLKSEMGQKMLTRYGFEAGGE